MPEHASFSVGQKSTAENVPRGVYRTARQMKKKSAGRFSPLFISLVLVGSQDPLRPAKENEEPAAAASRRQLCQPPNTSFAPAVGGTRMNDPSLTEGF